MNSGSGGFPSVIGKYRVKKDIGEGGFGIVMLGEHIVDHSLAAIKIIDRNEVTKQDALSYLENELRISSRLMHPNIVKVFDVIYTPEKIMIIMEYMSQGDLHSLLQSSLNFSFEELLRFSYQLLDALDYLHSRGISHRDIKPENILFNEDFCPKLIDFGLSKEKAVSQRTYCGTPLFIAPEIVKSKDYDGRKADIWSFGVTLCLMALKRFPWINVHSQSQYFNLIKTNKLEIKIDNNTIIGEILRRCLAIDPNERPTAHELMELINSRQKQMAFISKVDFRRYPTNLPSLNSRSNMSFNGTNHPMLIPKNTIHPKFIVRKWNANATQRV